MYDLGMRETGSMGDDDGAGAADLLDGEINEALVLLQQGLDRLLDIGDRGDLCALGSARLIEFAQRFESHRSRLHAIDTSIIEAAGEERLDDYTCSRSLPLALAAVLRISRTTARARVARAKQMMPRDSFTSGTATAELPVLAEAVRSGAVTEDQASIIGTAMAGFRMNPEIGAEQTAIAEHILVSNAAALGPDDLRTVAVNLDNALMPDGVLPRERAANARRALTIGPERRDGTHSITGALTRVAYTRLMSVLTPLAAPRPADDPLGADPRTAAQRMHDALEDAATRLLDSAGLPRAGGTPATVHVVVDADQLRAAVTAQNAPWVSTRAVATTGFGSRITFCELVRLAEQTNIVPTYLGSTQGVVAYGRTRRCATEGQTQALIARDRGCSFPGCDAPPQWCERHHVVPWHHGGRTDLENLTLLCGYHHREFEARGWQVFIQQGLPVWKPPDWIDPQRRPQVNARIGRAAPFILGTAA